MERCNVFVSEDTPRDGLCEVQIQMAGHCMTLTAANLSFARRIVDFVSETKDNPKYRDMRLANGHYRHMPEKSVELSPSFRNTRIELEKDGEFDDSYVLRIRPSSDVHFIFPLVGLELDAFVACMQEIIDDYCDPVIPPST